MTTYQAELMAYSARFIVAQPFVRSAFEEQKEILKRDMRKLVK